MADEKGRAHAHSSPYHHVGPCDALCRAGRRVHHHRDQVSNALYAAPALYRGSEGRAEERRFEGVYIRKFEREGEPPAEAKTHARRVYGATVGKVKREQRAKQGGN